MENKRLNLSPVDEQHQADGHHVRQDRNGNHRDGVLAFHARECFLVEKVHAEYRLEEVR